MASTRGRDLGRRLVRSVDRALLGAFMAALALVVERRLRKALRRAGDGDHTTGAD